MKKVVTLGIFILHLLTIYSQCTITWVNGASTNPSVNRAASFLCSQNIIESQQNANIYNNVITRKELAVFLYKSLFPSWTAPSDYFPVPFVDVDISIVPNELSALKAMHYLEYNNGISPYSRDYFFTNATLGFMKRGDAIKAMLEAWNIAPDWTNYNANSNATSSFYSDILVNDPNYGWIQKAKSLGITDTIPLNSSCTYNCLNNSTPLSIAQTYVLIHRLWLAQSKPTIDSSHFYIPNNFSINNISNKAGLDRAVFENYEDPSFNIPGGGLPISFSHSYHSDLTELPILPSDNYDNFKEALIQSINSLGIGWTHSYNSKIVSTKNFENGRFVEQKFVIRWADGSTEVYDNIFHRYVTPAVKDEFYIISKNSSNYAERIEIKKRNGTRLLFSLESSLGILNLDTIIDRYNNRLIFTYQTGTTINGYAPKRLYSVTDNYSNRSIYFHYQGGTNYLDSITDPINRSIRYYLNSSTKDLDSFRDAKLKTTKYQYDTSVYKHLLKTIVRPKGNSITNNYFKRKLKSTQSNAYAINVSFTTNYLQNSSTTQSQISITQNGNTLKTDYTHNDRGNTTKVKSATENIKIIYDFKHPDLPSEVMDSLTGIRKYIRYDINGNDTNIIIEKSNQSITSKIIYTDYDLPLKYYDAYNQMSENVYDNNFSLIKSITAEKDTTSFIVNSKGLTLAIIDPCGNRKDIGYNVYGNMDSISIAGTDINAKAYYDSVSRLIGIRDPKKVTSTIEYDANDNAIQETTDTFVRKSLYDANDNLTRSINHSKQVTDLIYDFDTDDLIEERFGNKKRKWSYNEDGSYKTATNKNSYTSNFDYYPVTDPRAGLVKSDGYAGFSYNAVTKLLDTVKRIGTNKFLKYHYDAFGRTDSITYNDLPNNTVGYGYDDNSNIISIQYPFNPNWKIYYAYNANNQLTNIRDWNYNILISYAYRKNGQLESELYANGIKTFYNYDKAGRLDSIYTTDNTGKLIISCAASLDNLGQHIRESHYIDQSDTTGIQRFSLNLPLTYSTDTTNVLLNTNIGNYTSDSNGNFKTDPQGGQYLWDDKDNQISYQIGSQTKLSEYDPLEIRRRYDTTRFALDIFGKGNILVEMSQLGNPVALYVHGLGLVCRINIADQKRACYHYDFRGSTLAITNELGQIIGHYDYDAFGGVKTQKSPSFRNWFTYVGKYGVMADEPDRYYMRARHYVPSLGRFIGADPVWNSNLFIYGEDNPIGNIDPDGEIASGIAVGIGYGIRHSASKKFQKNLGEYALSNIFYNTMSIEQMDKLYSAVKFINDGKYLGTGIVENWFKSCEKRFINNYVSGKSTLLPTVGMAITSLWRPSTYLTTVSAITLPYSVNKAGLGMTKKIGLTGAKKLFDMRTKFGRGIKTGRQIYEIYETTEKAFK